MKNKHKIFIGLIILELIIISIILIFFRTVIYPNPCEARDYSLLDPFNWHKGYEGCIHMLAFDLNPLFYPIFDLLILTIIAYLIYLWVNTRKNKMTSQKKAQMKIQQTAFMLLAVTLFFVLVGMAVLAFKYSELKETATDLEQENARLLVSKLANSPEFSCGAGFGTAKTNCIDADKAMMLKANIAKYTINTGTNFWGVANIEIRKIYPISQNYIICSLGNYPNCNIIRITKLTNNEILGNYISNFVSLCRKQQIEGSTGYYDKCEIAKLLVSYKEQ